MNNSMTIVSADFPIAVYLFVFSFKIFFVLCCFYFAVNFLANKRVHISPLMHPELNPACLHSLACFQIRMSIRESYLLVHLW